MGIGERAARLLSRRAFLGSVAGLALARSCAAGEFDRLVWPTFSEKTPALNLERRYRADAQVLLFGFSVLHREGVGGGGVLWREYAGDGPARLLEFNGFSLPQRAAGLNRLGLIRELERTAETGAECDYFGVMTASPEESSDEFHKALHPSAKEQAYTAIEGRNTTGRTATATAHFMAPAAISGQSMPEMEELAKRALASVQEVVAADGAGGSSHSFLQELGSLMLRPDGVEGRYLYAGRAYRLHLSRTVDGKATAQFRARRLIPDSAKIIRVDGRLRREAGGKETDFRLWISNEAQRPVPLRIEYQAKSYLRLVFEAVE